MRIRKEQEHDGQLTEKHLLNSCSLNMIGKSD